MTSRIGTGSRAGLRRSTRFGTPRQHARQLLTDSSVIGVSPASCRGFAGISSLKGHTLVALS
jgi:hypothetical protein